MLPPTDLLALVLLCAPPLARAADGGAFGTWATDADGLPLYEFTCDQTVQRAAITNYSRTARDSAEAGETGAGPFEQDPSASIFHIGNDELVLLLSTAGYAQVRQDEGGPKLLNDHSPPDGQFGGGLGYLVDAGSGEVLLTTHYAGAAASPQQHYRRQFGVGHARRTLSQRLSASGEPDGLVAENRLIVPFGSDPIVVSQTVLTNRGDKPLSLSWYEAWGAQMWQMAYGAQGQRRQFQRSQFTTQVEPMSDLFGATTTTTFVGNSTAPAYGAPGATLWDESPPTMFLVNAYEHDVTTDVGCSASAFFGTGGAARPALGMSCGGTPRANQATDAAMILRRNLTLAVGETTEFAFVFGYVPQASAAAAIHSLITKYSYGATRGNELLTANGQFWRRDIPALSVEHEPWMGREVAWNYAMTRQTLTYDDFFNESILDQGTGYRYDMGFQGAARDPLQHALPFIHTAPGVVKSIIRYTLKELHPPTDEPGDAVFNLPYFVIGHGIVGPPDGATVGARPSDEELYLMYATTEYVLATKDTAFLRESVVAYNSTLNRTVLGALVDCFRYLKHNIGVGEHGLLRMQTGKVVIRSRFACCPSR